MAILKRGLAGEPVKLLQRKLGIEVDGRFGAKTEEALKAYQQKNGLAADGVAGPDTFVQMQLFELMLLKTGTSGESVKKLQAALGVTADGRFGPATEKAVRDFQEQSGLEADGLAGPATLAKLNLFREITPEVVEKSHVPGEATEAAAPAPGAAPMQAGTAASGRRSIWETVKSFFD